MATTPSFTIKQFDTLPQLPATLRDGTGAPIPLTNAVSVFLHMAAPSGGVKVNRACNIVNPTLGAVTFDWLAADTDTAGTWECQFKITWGNGAPQRVPNTGNFLIQVTPSFI